MNIEQARAQFMAQHLGQTLYGTGYKKLNGVYYSGGYDYFGTVLKIDSACLLLRSIEQLTDEECATIAPILSLKICRYTKGNIIKIMAGHVDTTYRSCDIVIASELLKRFGILIGFVYLNELNQPITLTPAEIVQRGWCKLKES